MNKKISNKLRLAFVFPFVSLVLYCVSCAHKNAIEECEDGLTEIADSCEVFTVPPPPDINVLRKAIRIHGDSMSLEKYLNYYHAYQDIDNDSILYYSHLMADKYSYGRAYYVMFHYWTRKYKEGNLTGTETTAFVDSAMYCLVEGSKLGVKGCNILLAVLYANGIYFERDTALSNECLRKAGVINVTEMRKMYEDYYQRENLNLFMNAH